MTLKQYAKQEGITLGAAYLRVWNGHVPGATRIDGRWIIKTECNDQDKTADFDREAQLASA